MGVSRKNFIFSSFIEIFDPDIPLLPLESIYEFAKRKRLLSRRQCRDSVKGLRQRGVLKVVKKDNQAFLALTKKGVLHILLEKAKVNPLGRWDGKWRIIIFDIPEDFSTARDRFRKLLVQNQFIKLQNSVFISPYSLNRDAIRYLEEVGLLPFIRIMKVEEIDNDSDIRKKFGF